MLANRGLGGAGSSRGRREINRTRFGEPGAKEGNGVARASAAKLIIGIPLDNPDLLYASGFRAVDPVVLLDTGNARTLVVSSMESGRAARECPSVRVLTPAAMGIRKRVRGGMALWAKRLLDREGLRRVRVPSTFPLGAARFLERRGVGLQVEEGPFYRERAVKRPDEIRRIGEAQEAAVIAMRAAIRMIGAAAGDRDGFLKLGGSRLTSEAVRLEIQRVLLDRDCVGQDLIVAGGDASTDPHAVGEGPLRAHEPIVIDIFPRHQRHGYWGDLTRTVVRGEASPKLRRQYAAVRAAQLAALAAVRPGVSCSTVNEAAKREFKRRGFETGYSNGRPHGFIHGAGHGVGLAIHEAPSVANVEGRLRAGNVITIEPGLYYPGIGGIRIEDTIVVTRTGWRNLGPCEKRFELLD
jgi:Xaa-Pro aminopeptidase